MSSIEQQIIGVVLGATSLFAGYVLSQLSQMRSRELSYLQHVPQFRDFTKLGEHLKNSPSQRADVLVEGHVDKLNSQVLRSEYAGVEGVARIVTTTTYSKVYQQSGDNAETWRDVSNTIENVKISVPFRLADNKGNGITVNSIHTAGGIKQILQRVWQEKLGPDSRSIGDYATNMTLREIPNGSLMREFLLVIGTSVGVYGSAVLQVGGPQGTAHVSLAPVEVDSSIHNLISRNEMIVSTLNFFSLIFLVGGGSILLITILPTLLKMLGVNGGRQGRRRRRRPAIDARDDSDFDSGNDSGND